MSRVVAYYRVSTVKQGVSGLGLDAQRSSVEALCAARGWEIVAPPFVEVESGKRNDRPELAKAIARAKLVGARLVIAKMDRVGRKAARLLTILEESGVKFIAADDPDADWTSIAIKAVIAQHEGDAISRRTREALAVKRERLAAEGRRLGNPNGAAALRRAGKGNAAALAALKAGADEHAKAVRPEVDRLRASGVTSLRSIAAALNEAGIRTPRDKAWHAGSVRAMLARNGAET